MNVFANFSKPHRRILRLSRLTFAVLATLSGIPHAGAATVLGTADSFAVLAGSMVTNVPTSNIVGNVGVWPGSAITGFNSSPGVAVSDPQVTGGLVHAGTVAAQLAQNDLTGAITSLGLMGTGTTLINPDLAGLTLIPGVYSVHSGVSNLTGTLTLDGQGNANAGWVFLMDSDLITSPSSTVNVINTGSGAGVFWDVRSSATLDTATSFQGNILADQSITLNTGATIGCGRTLASVAAVTLHTNTLGIGCGAGSGGEGSNGFSGGLTVSTSGGIPVFLAPAPVPLPPAVWLFGSGLLGVISVARRKTRGTNESAST